MNGSSKVPDASEHLLHTGVADAKVVGELQRIAAFFRSRFRCLSGVRNPIPGEDGDGGRSSSADPPRIALEIVRKIG